MDLKNDIFATPEGKRDFVIALIVIAIFAVLIYQFLFKTDVVEASGPPEVVAAPITDEDEEDHFLYTNSDTYTATTILTEAAYDTAIETAIETAIVISDIDKSSPISTEAISKPLDTATKTIPLAKIVNQAADSSSTAAENEASNVPQISEEAKEQVQKTGSTTSIAINCVVVVGVFKEESNKTAVIEKLKSMGHGYAEGILRENLRYVGVPVPCDNEQERQKLLNALNRDFGIDSWVMRLKVQ